MSPNQNCTQSTRLGEITDESLYHRELYNFGRQFIMRKQTSTYDTFYPHSLEADRLMVWQYIWEAW